MKIYLADAKQIDWLGFGRKLKVKNYLESYWVIKNKKIDILKWEMWKTNEKQILPPSSS